MSKKRTHKRQPRAGAKSRDGKSDSPQRKDRQPSPTEKPQRPALLSAGAMREVVESVVIAFVLAFLFRTFEAEAFVIPTGSMAPTLMGRHKDLVCENCGYPFQVSASDEVDNTTGRRKKNVDVIACTCPMCRYTMELDDDNPPGTSYRSYKGDRILVAKFPYQFVDPTRWDVAVFKYPGEAKTNFIKRIVGLPNETIDIRHGDIYVRNDAKGEEDFSIARKPPHKVMGMLQPVYDNDYVQPELIVDDLWPARWTPVASPGDGSEGGWEPAEKEETSEEDYRSFQTNGQAEGEVWLRYRHFVPSHEDWQYLKQGERPGSEPPNPQLITDFSAYNTDVVGSAYDRQGAEESWLAINGQGFGEAGAPTPGPDKLGLHWVGDLAVECEMKVVRKGGEAVFELVEGGRVFQCRINLDDGKAAFSIEGLEEFQPVLDTGIEAPGTYRVRFANIDDRLLLWVDRHVDYFDYPPLGNTQPQRADLEPVRIGSQGAALEISHLKVGRDVYYIAQRPDPDNPQGLAGPITDFVPNRDFPYSPFTRHTVAGVLSNPNAWDKFALARRIKPFQLEADQFLALGDNSAESKDSRLWGRECYVSRELLIGKALVIYWPHSLDKIPGTSIPIRFFPNFRRMWFVE